MYVDKELLLSDNQALHGVGTGDEFSTNIIDLGAIGRDPGKGKPVAVVITIVEGCTSATGDTATVTFKLWVNDDADTASVTDIAATGAILVSALTKGRVIAIPFPAGLMESDSRYVGLNYYIGVEALTAGHVDAFIAFDW